MRNIWHVGNALCNGKKRKCVLVDNEKGGALWTHRFNTEKLQKGINVYMKGLDIMFSGFCDCSVPMIPDMDNVDLFFHDEGDEIFEIPKMHYDGVVDINDEKPMYDYKEDIITLKRGDCIVEHKQFSNFDVLVKDENGQPIWLNGMEANMCGYSADEVIDYRPAKTYWLTEYDLEKSEKKQYKVTLEETLEMDMWDHKRLSDRFK